MAGYTVLSILLPWLLFLLPNPASALSPISVKGTKLFDDDGNQFYVKGVAYASDNKRMDPLADTGQCQIDAGLMKSLGVNTIRVYIVDGTKNHDGCMQAFASQGIYVWLDLANPVLSINRGTPTWTMELYTNWTGTVDTFAGYDNLLFFNIGNEVINEIEESTLAAPFIKAAARDIKAFRDARGYRSIPVGYSAADVEEYRKLTAEYLACGDVDDTIDIYGMNIYSWCGNSSYYRAGYDKLYEEFQDLNIPVLFSETGCVSNDDGRDFAEVGTMLGPVFQALFSGTVVYEWAMRPSRYGIVKYSNDHYTGFPSTLDDYNALSTVFSTAHPTGTARTAYKPSNSAPACPPANSSASWPVNAAAVLPTIAGLDAGTVTARTTITTSHTGTETSTSTAGSKGGESEGQEEDDEDDEDGTGGNGGLSAGAIAGIAVGCAVLVIGILVAAFLVWRRRRAQKQDLGVVGGVPVGGVPMSPEDDPHHEVKAELAAESVQPVVPRQEMDAWQHPQQPQQYQPQGHYTPGGVDGGGTTQSHPYEMQGSVPPASELHTHND